MLFLFGVFCGFLISTATAQDPNAPYIPDWKEYTYKDHLMAFSLPAPPHFKTQDADTDHGKSTIYAYSAPAGNGAVFMVSATEYTGTLTDAEQAELLASAVKASPTNLKATVISNKKIALEDHSGVELEMTSEKWHVRYRIFVVATKMYQLIYMTPAAAPVSPEVDKFLNSFHILKP